MQRVQSDSVACQAISLPRTTFGSGQTALVVYDKALSPNGILNSSPGNCVIGYLPRPKGCNRVLFGILGEGFFGITCEYDANGKCTEYRSPSWNPRVFNPVAATTRFKATFETAKLDYTYLIDGTHNKFIWRGKYVPDDVASTYTLALEPDDTFIEYEH